MRRHTWLAVLTGLAVYAWSTASPNVQLGSENVGDTPLYQRYGENARDGLVPYADFFMEYPPAALPVFVAPTVGDRDDYARNSKLLQIAFGAGCLVLMVIALVPAARRPHDLYLAALLFAVSPLLLGRVTFARFDFWPSLLAVGAVALAAHGRLRLGSIAVAVGTLAKVFPVVLFPLLFVAARERARRYSLECVAAFGAALLVVLGPLAVVGAGGLRFSLTSQLERPLQIESLGGSLLLALGELGLYSPRVELTHSSHNLIGTLPDAVGAVLGLLTVVLLVAVWLWFRSSAGRAPELLTAAAAAVAVFVTFGRVLSPQYLIWLLPLVPLARGRRGTAASLLVLAAVGLTQIWSQGRYTELVELGSISWGVLVRNVALVAATVLLVAQVASYREGGRT
jgi:hypothetical protein